MSLRIALIAFSAFIVLGLAGALFIQSHRLDVSERQLLDTRERLEATTRAMNELSAMHAAELARKTLQQTASEAIRSAPEGDNGAIGQILLRSLKSADEMGGH